MSNVTVTDLFCGAGGSSIGATSVEGVELVVAANHWQTAIDVHQAHFPEARHDVADISQADPRRYPRTDILMASPECTNHSQAKGISRKRQDPSTFDSADLAAERSRATMWDVVRFAEQIPYQAIVVENVVEATKWGPNGNGALWNAWRMAMESFGYTLHLLSHNSMHHGVAQSRDRMYVVATLDHLQPDLEMEKYAFCERCEAGVVCRQTWKNGRTVGRYRQQWYWSCVTCGDAVDPPAEPAASIIDWSLPAPTIGGRARPLVKATRDRIWNGALRLGFVERPAPFTTTGAGNTHERTPGNRARSLDDPLPVQQTTLTSALVAPPTAVIPMRAHGNAYDAHQSPVGAITANGNHHGLLMRNQGTTESWACTRLEEPARTLTTRGHQSLVLPYNARGVCSSASWPLPTVTTRDGAALVNAPGNGWSQQEKDRFIDECGFRMLAPPEVAAAMAFPEGYIPTSLPTRAQVKLAGNAVTPPVMQWLIGRITQAM